MHNLIFIVGYQDTKRWLNPPDSKVHGAYMGPTQGPGRLHVGPMNRAIRFNIIHTYEDLCARSMYQGHVQVITFHHIGGVITCPCIWCHLLAPKSSYQLIWNRNNVMTSSNGNIFRVIGHLCGNSPVTGEFPAQRPVTRSFGVFFDLCLNERFSKQSWGWWFETPSRPSWRHCNENGIELRLVTLAPTWMVLLWLQRNLVYMVTDVTLQRPHNERDGVSNHRRRSKKTLKLRVTGLCEDQ